MDFYKAMGSIIDYIGRDRKNVYKIEINATYNQLGMADVTIHQYDTDENGNKYIEDGEVAVLPPATFHLHKWGRGKHVKTAEFLEITAFGDPGPCYLEV